MGRRTDELVAATKNFIEAHDRWADPQSNRPDDPDESYWEAYDYMVDTWDTGDIPSACRELHELVTKLMERNAEFNEVASDSNQDPGPRFFGAVHAIRNHLTAKEKRPIKFTEPLKDIMALPGMSTMQAAKMYGFIDRHGNPMPHLVTRELETPGSVTKTPGAVDGRDWFDPLNPPEVAEDSDDDTDDKPIRRPARDKPKAVDKPKCPESLDDLRRQKVPLEQVVRMTGLTAEHIKAEWEKLAKESEKAERASKMKELQAAETS